MSITSDRIRENDFIHWLADDAADDIERLEAELAAERAKLTEAQDMIAMLHGALELAQSGSCRCLTKTHVASFHSEFCQYRIISEAITATAETVAAWRKKETEKITDAEANRWTTRLSWLHTKYDTDGSGCDSGDALDVIESEINQVINRFQEETEQLRREVAMLRNAMFNYLHPANLNPNPIEAHKELLSVINNTQSTAFAYEREVAAKAREACAVICDVAEFNGKGAHYCAVTIRAASNKPKAPHIIGADYAKSRDTTAVLCARCLVVLDSKDIEAHVCVSNKEKQE